MLLNPMIFMVFYILTLGLVNFVVRFKAIRRRQLHFSHFKIYDTKNYDVPEKIVRFGRHFDNQFQLPLLFLITCVVAQTTPLYSMAALPILSWSFIATRIMHSFIHLGKNNVRYRSLAYFSGWIVIAAMWCYIVMNAHV